MHPFMRNPHLKITSGDAEVYDSGSVITFDEKPITLEFGAPSSPLKLVLEFKKDATGNVNIKAETLEKNTLKLEMTNVGNILGGGTISPIHIGDIEGKKLYFGFRVNELNDSKQLSLIYTIYLYGNT